MLRNPNFVKCLFHLITFHQLLALNLESEASVRCDIIEGYLDSFTTDELVAFVKISSSLYEVMA